MPGIPRVAAPPDCEMAIAAWNMMGGIDWSALPIVMDILGLEDVDILIAQLVIIRDEMNERAK